MTATAIRPQDLQGVLGTPGTGKGWLRRADGAMEWTDLATQAEQDALEQWLPTLDGWCAVVPHPIFFLTTSAASGNTNMMTSAVRVPKTGTITDFMILIGGVSAGNIDAAISRFDGTNYNAVWRKGSTPCPGVNAWTSLGNPAIAVTRGEIIYFSHSTDSTTATFGRAAASTTANQLVVPTGWLMAGTGRLNWTKTASFPIPLTTAESTVSTTSNIWALAARITP